MKTCVVWLGVMGFSVLSSGSSADVAGVWTLEFQPSLSDRYMSDAPSSSDCTLTQQGPKLTGRCGADEVPVMGQVKGQHVTFEIKSGSTAILTGALDANGTRLTGTWHIRSSVGKFTGTKHPPVQ